MLMIALLGKDFGPAVLEPPAWARNRRTATVKIPTKPVISFSFYDPKIYPVKTIIFLYCLKYNFMQPNVKLMIF